MNTKNNKRRQASCEKIERAFLNMITEKSVGQITVTEICKAAGLNRTTFYANYADVFAVADCVRDQIENSFHELFERKENHTATALFRMICENQLLFKIYFKLGYAEKYSSAVYDMARVERDFGGKYVEYHIEFFRSGLTAVIKKWLDGGCKETPEEMSEVLRTEYGGR